MAQQRQQQLQLPLPIIALQPAFHMTFWCAEVGLRLNTAGVRGIAAPCQCVTVSSPLLCVLFRLQRDRSR